MLGELLFEHRALAVAQTCDNALRASIAALAQRFLGQFGEGK